MSEDDEQQNGNEDRQDSHDPITKPTAWQEFWKTNTATALVTVAATGIVGGIINGLAQQAITDRQFKNEIIQTANQHFLDTQRAMLDKRVNLARQISTLLGRIADSGNSLIFSLRHPGAVEQRKVFGRDFEEARKQWERNRIGFKVELGLYYPDEEEVRVNWSQVVAAVRVYLDVVVRVANPKPDDPEQDGHNEKLKSLVGRTKDLGDLLVRRAAEYPWVRLESQVNEGLEVLERIQDR